MQASCCATALARSAKQPSGRRTGFNELQSLRMSRQYLVRPLTRERAQEGFDLA
jgi:hypothetical protein